MKGAVFHTKPGLMARAYSIASCARSGVITATALNLRLYRASCPKRDLLPVSAEVRGLHLQCAASAVDAIARLVGDGYA